jgi:hypothetical protein
MPAKYNQTKKWEFPKTAGRLVSAERRGCSEMGGQERMQRAETMSPRGFPIDKDHSYLAKGYF